jgi:hypothetical protein
MTYVIFLGGFLKAALAKLSALESRFPAGGLKNQGAETKKKPK